MTMQADLRAHHIAVSADMVSEMLREQSIECNIASRVFALLAQMKESAERLSDELDPCNPHGLSSPLYPEEVAAPSIVNRSNVIPIRGRRDN